MLMSIWLSFCLTQHQASTDNTGGAHLAKTTLPALQMLHSFVNRWGDASS